jgi:energy-coupling factor transport system ATP-binding protein
LSSNQTGAPTTHAAEPIIELESVKYEYAATDKWALSDVSVRIYPGEYVAFLGPCGAGKTTLCLTMNGIVPNMMMGYLEGSIRVKGKETRKSIVREVAKTVGMVFDNPEYQLSQLTVREEVALGLENIGVPREEILPRVAEALQIVGLVGFESRSPMALSGGQQQRLAIAAALAMYPAVLVLDEPTSNLDPIGKQEVFDVAARLNRERHMTIVIAEHEVEVMAAYADRILVLDQGRLVLQGSPSEVFQHVDQLNKIGVRVPQVTEAAHGVRSPARTSHRDLPVTLEEAVHWVEQDRPGSEA